MDRSLTLVAGLIACVPVLLIAIVLRLVHGKGGVFFTQHRPGKNEVIFKLVKFKTMNDKRDLDGNLLSDGERMTRIGKFIRKTSLDELPQLWNVLKGDMSLVGPRPLLVQYLPLYSTEQKRRHLVKPGITGWAQVNGRNAISWEEKFRLDVWYVDHVSFALDLKILFLTVKKVFIREGISAQGHATMDYFKGTQER
ncbi:MAG: sugar transferase [Gammaproteobacteria bacterium]|nr:sugar transferase [Chitinophagia bacterium]NDH69177.1 sugar transferase [Gammaproteobacteria bacterium]